MLDPDMQVFGMPGVYILNPGMLENGMPDVSMLEVSMPDLCML